MTTSHVCLTGTDATVLANGALRDQGATPGAVKVLHAITGLSIGGAEWMLYRLLAESDRTRFDPTVVSLLEPGAIARQIAALDVSIRSLDMVERAPHRLPLIELGRIARAVQPDLLQGWMYHGNLAATFCWWRLGRNRPLVWSVHHSAADLSHEKRSTRLAVQVSARLSRRTSAIVYCSSHSARQHEQLGFAADKTRIIPNGFDCAEVRPDPEAKARLCAQLGLDPRRVLIGKLTRANPMKDHGNLIRAATILVERGFDVQLLLVGRGVADPDGPIARLAGEAGLGDRLRLIEELEDLRPVTAGLDILASSSAWGEAFPLIVGDAMASGVPCVVTDVGDCGWIVGDTGMVVPPRDSAALAAALGRLIALGPEGRRELGRRARARIEAKFSLAEVTRQYQSLYQEVIGAQAIAQA